MAIQAGRFKAEPQRHKLIEAKYANGETVLKDGEPIIKMGIVFKLLEGPNVGMEVAFEGGFMGGGEEFTTKAMATCGWDGNPETMESSWKYRQVYVVIEQRTYEKDGKSRTVAEVKYINALDDQSATPGARLEKLEASEAAKSSLKARLAASLAAKAQAEGNASPTPAPARRGRAADFGGTGADDDIPF